jgi:hypothetical protein
LDFSFVVTGLFVSCLQPPPAPASPVGDSAGGEGEKQWKESSHCCSPPLHGDWQEEYLETTSLHILVANLALTVSTLAIPSRSLCVDPLPLCSSLAHSWRYSSTVLTLLVMLLCSATHVSVAYSWQHTHDQCDLWLLPLILGNNHPVCAVSAPCFGGGFLPSLPASLRLGCLYAGILPHSL